MLKYLLKHNPPPDPTKETIVKFAFDGGVMTSTKRRSQEHGTLQVFTKCNMREAKSHFNTHQWLLYLGDENYDTLKEELDNTLPEINELIKNEKVLYLTRYILFTQHYRLK